MQLFQRNGTLCQPVEQWLAPLESDIHHLIGTNLKALLGLTLITHEFDTGTGRMDSLCIDEAGGPVIVEYKRARKDNVINQALFYQAWLLDHREVFERLAAQVSPAPIDWTGIRIICIASEFSHYDMQALPLFKANIDLVTYALFGQDLLALNLQGSHRLSNFRQLSKTKKKPRLDFEKRLAFATVETQRLFHDLIDFIQAQNLPFSVQERGDGVELVQGDVVARLRLKGSSIMRLQCWFKHDPQELKHEMDDKWHPGLDAYRRVNQGFEISIFDALSLDAAKEILLASASLHERASIWS